VPNIHVPSSTYKSALLKKASDTYFGPSVKFAAGPNVLNSQAVSQEFYKGIVDFMSDPTQLDAILQRIDASEKAK
ncbi:MAG: hypothetical protein ABI377_08900, partial [Devosia sp.]